MINILIYICAVIVSVNVSQKISYLNKSLVGAGVSCHWPEAITTSSDRGLFYMQLIALRNGTSAQVDDVDFLELSKYKWYALQNYVRRAQRINDKQIILLMHRVVMGITDPKIFIDHIDGNPLNNQRNNLRVATQSQNCMNKKKSNTAFSSQFKGVSFHNKSNTWNSAICKDYKMLYIGSFRTEIEAAAAYNEHALRLFGQYARLNDVPEGTAYEYLSNCKPVIQMLNGVVVNQYPSAAEAIAATGIKKIYDCCSNPQRNKSAGGFQWKYQIN